MGRSKFTEEQKILAKSMIEAGKKYKDVQAIIKDGDGKPISLGKISDIVKEYEANKPLVEAYKANRADILAHDQMRYSKHITEEKLAKTSARDLEVMRGIAHDHERLERGQSTENVHYIVQAIRSIKQEENESTEIINTN